MENTNSLHCGNLLLLNSDFFPNLNKKPVKVTGVYENGFLGFSTLDGSFETVIKCDSLSPLSITPETLNLFEVWTNKDSMFVNQFYFRYDPTKSQVSVWRMWSGFILNVGNIHSLQNAYTLFSGGEQLKLK